MLDIKRYKNLDEYLKDVENNNDSINKSDFEYDLGMGTIRDITLGTYNGASDTFHPRELTDENIKTSILSSIKEHDYIESHIMDELGNEYSESKAIEWYCNNNTVFIIEDTKFIYVLV